MEIKSKSIMYQMLHAGRFGNTIQQHFDVEQWKSHPEFNKYDLWGIRSSVHANHPATRMNVPRSEVEEYAKTHFADGVNISHMIDRLCDVWAWLDIWDSPSGISVEGVLSPPKGMSWRSGMRSNLRKSFGTSILKSLLNENSYDDLLQLFDLYPGHVVEVSALAQCHGTIPGRNAIVWEVRAY